ncbi:CG5440 [Drosophila busckii]|uniref:CG5440 n=1 Tax=Drosophila busckii TaxID=30019 RepID=A0A0M4EV84_DROBS|nr:ubiquitin-conjugating enzyme E2 D2B [Drosophila busckii]ALC49135.1 CG5440 [Drosophila busckii]
MAAALQQLKPNEQQCVMPTEDNEPSTSRTAQAAAAAAAASASPMLRIQRELHEIGQHPPPNCSAELHKEDLYHWRATLTGPSGSVYEGGSFRLDIRFPPAYPFRPPQVRFMTRIYHCNVDSRGVICLDVLNERWSPVLNIAKVLLSIWVLMSECNPNDPLVMGIAEQYKTNRKEHDKIARYWTKRFAMAKTTQSTANSNTKLENCSSSSKSNSN